MAMTTKEIIDVVQAYERGEEIETRSHWSTDWNKIESPLWDFRNYDYRVKPKVEFRSYENVDEMIEDFDHRFPSNRGEYTMPLIWLKARDDEDMTYFITKFSHEEVSLGSAWYDMNDLFEKLVYLDGSQVGKLVSE